MWRYIGLDECKDFLLSLGLIDCKDSKEYIRALYSITNSSHYNYRIYKIKKRNGKFRTIYEPSPLLKSIQKKILLNILDNKTISKYAKAYHKGISLKDNAICHVNKEVVLKLDIKDFFENITFTHIYNSCFPIEYFPKSIGMLLTYLCTYDDHLTQGSPTSSYISNLIMKDFDDELGLWCQNNNISYTRYSDDMTFSGNFNPSEVIIRVRKMLGKLGLELNKDKIHVIKKSAQQNVTGIVVNNKLQVSSKYRKKIRQELYYIKKFGVESHLDKLKLDMNVNQYLNSLYGRIIYVLQINSNDYEFINYKKLINTIDRKSYKDEH